MMNMMRSFVKYVFLLLIGDSLLGLSFRSKSIHRSPFLRFSTAVRQGFGSSYSPVGQKNPPNKMDKLERKINSLILKEKGLEEALDLYRSLIDFQIAKQDSVLNSFFVQKYNKFQSVKRKYGWSEEKIRRKMLEITWNSVAKERNEHHQLQMESLSSAKLEYVNDLCSWILLPTSNPSTTTVHRLLDVGCGNGILLKFLEERSLNSFSKHYNYTGIDISQEMIKIASQLYPHRSKQFIVQSFLDHRNPVTNSNERGDDHTYDCIIFHECLHYFSNITEAIHHSINLLGVKNKDYNEQTDMKTTKRIVISHPKGIQNVQLQYSANRLLVPSVLPTRTELLELGKLHSFNVEYYSEKDNQYYLTVLTFP